jgi:hypothetical protein
MCLIGSIWASIRGIFVKIPMCHLRTSNMHALNYCHNETKFTTRVSLLMQVCVCVCVCVCLSVCLSLLYLDCEMY